MAFEGLWGAAAGKRSEGCNRELCEAKSAWRPTISMRFSSRRSPRLLTHCVYHPQSRWPALQS
eukprot:2388847-Prymnesium_polylepis.1